MAIEDRIGPYRMLRLIRRGGQGSIFLGFDDRLQRRIAAKLYTLPADREQSKRALREAQLVASLDSPRVVQVYDVIVSSGHLAMVMEYVPGCDLEELLNRCELCLASMLAIATDITAALAVARQSRIVHGDLKPSNVLVAPDGRIKLTDFGIAGNHGALHDRRGSFACLSPEHVLGQPLDVRSDLFALGCLMYRMLSGRHPFLHEGRLDGQALLHRMPAPLPAGLPDGTPLPVELAQMVDGLLAKDPAERPQNTHSVRQQLSAIASAIPRTLKFPLVEEARVAFREETADELPLQIPPGLRSHGRSRMPLRPGQWALFGFGRHWRRSQWLGAAAGLALVVALSLTWFWPRANYVFVPSPQWRYDGNSDLPAGTDTLWLLQQLHQLSLQADPSLRFSGEAPVFRSTKVDRSLAALRRPPPPEHLLISLNCQAGICVLGLERQRENWQRYRQALLLPGAPASHWREVMDVTVQQLYGSSPRLL
ncbi:serine/threonine-protein kinase [Kineobactrum salinum]|uniref:non-specific serine/threonine protein kinase n=1 Tax=Kineobactrum salinum TaxID=2708301 RepID=A0A6C0U6R7_9GAMM|nr:serine/threonine-protein kinase [Kineobactrum salinum]QIB66637.1 serine/threonine protein kinase [Kineobactrum salinum]